MKNFLAGLLALVVVGCGGGGGDGGERTQPALQSGQVDPAYGSGGRAEAVLGPMRLLVSGDGSAYLVQGNAVWKLDPSGARVMSFGTAGEVLFEPGSGTRVAMNASGDLFGTVRSGVAKVDRDGRPDPTFGVGGVARADPDLFLFPLGVGVDAQDNVYLWSRRVNAPPETKIVTKLDARGRLLTDYGLGGVVDVAGELVTIDGPGSAYLARALADPASGEVRVLVDKLGADGGNAPGFAPIAGQVCSNPGLTAPVVDGGGNIYLAGSCRVGTQTAMLLKLDASGRVVSTFRSGIRADIPGGAVAAGANVSLNDAAVGRGGEIYLVGSTRVGESGCATGFVMKLDARGEPVTSFGNGGVVLLSPGTSSVANEVELDAAGRVYAGVYASTTCPGALRGIHPTQYVYRLGG